MTPHLFPLRVYYEDTDAGGVVYYANYLKFAERARTEFLREAGVNQSALECFFVVRHATLDLKAPARLDDMLVVETAVASHARASFEMAQVIRRPHPGAIHRANDSYPAEPSPLERGGIVLAALRVKIACVSREFKPIKIPGALSEIIAPCGKSG